MILVDTNVISEPLRKSPDAHVVEWLGAQPIETVYLSAKFISTTSPVDGSTAYN
jgi:toxin FitB